MATKKLNLNINGKTYTPEVDVRESLIDLIRYDLKLTGTKCGCSVGECGACTILIDGVPIDSCLYLAVWADGKEIRTIEGISPNAQDLSKVQEAFVEHGAIQCGYCTPGFIMTATALHENGARLDEAQIRKELSGNMCRCTGYQKIVEAVDELLNK